MPHYFDDVDEADADIPFDEEPLECLEASDECRGPVEYHCVGHSLRAWPRCDFHFEQRLDRYENSLERYADSDCVPEWFDPSYAGERWSDDY